MLRIIVRDTAAGTRSHESDRLLTVHVEIPEIERWMRETVKLDKGDIGLIAEIELMEAKDVVAAPHRITHRDRAP